MTIVRDVFWDDFHSEMKADGWRVLNSHRVPLRHYDGLTPTGKAFDVDVAADGTVTVKVGPRTWEGTITYTEDGTGLVTEIKRVHNNIPPSQQ